MKPLYHILFCLMCALPTVVGAAPVATTAGSNLTAYNSSTMGSINNNQWNSMMNNRTGVTTGPTADFGNCNALIMRCAQPKCSGCTTMDVARSIVAGCVNSNATCKQYGNDLVEFISAQLVSNAAAKAQQAEAAAQSAAASAAAAQTSAQMQQMQQQMQQMQYEMQQQNAATVAQLQAALEEQKQMTATAQQQVADAQIAQNEQAASGLTAAQEEAAARGVSADLLVREQVTGQIMSKLENAEVALKDLKSTMQNVFDYAGCDSKGNNCSGPKRVKVFKQKAMEFFDPYNVVLDELYDALITAQAVGVDITDIYMMLNGSCNVWGEYLCAGLATAQKDPIIGVYYQWPTYTTTECPQDGGKSRNAGKSNGGHECYSNQIIPPEDMRGCVLQRTLTSEDEVQRSWLETQSGDNMIRVGCASSALENSALFRGRKKQATIDIETLERIIEQDAPQTFGRAYGSGRETAPQTKYCAVTYEGMEKLQKAVAMKKLPDEVCISKRKLDGTLNNLSDMSSMIEDIYQKHKGDDAFWSRTGAMVNCDAVGGTWNGGAEGFCKCTAMDGSIVNTTDPSRNCISETQEEYVDEGSIPGYENFIKDLK